jgi:hypothetical protein
MIENKTEEIPPGESGHLKLSQTPYFFFAASPAFVCMSKYQGKLLLLQQCIETQP